MSGLCLTLEELREITGRMKASAQVRFLRQNGINFILRADGKPLVSRTHFEAIMGGEVRVRRPAEPEPDFSIFQ